MKYHLTQLENFKWQYAGINYLFKKNKPFEKQADYSTLNQPAIRKENPRPVMHLLIISMASGLAVLKENVSFLRVKRKTIQKHE